ncbi:DUF951 domain-containing protein [Peribacillus frigoritolerans]
MEKQEFNIDDVVEMKKVHPCGTYKWIIIRLGADIRIKCLGCNHSVLMSRREFERKVKKVQLAEKNDDIFLQQNDNVNSSFRWPSLNVKESKGDTNQNLTFKDQSDLNKLGYKITGLNREQRWKVLVSSALPKLGLENVVNIISSHIRNRKQQVNGIKKFKYAIAEWAYDLERLKREFYKNNFDWPNHK